MTSKPENARPAFLDIDALLTQYNPRRTLYQAVEAEIERGVSRADLLTILTEAHCSSCNTVVGR